MSITYSIINDAEEKIGDRILFLCADGMFRSGYWSLSKRVQTYTYRRVDAALKRLGKVGKKRFPNAAIQAVQTTDIGYATWIIRPIA